MIKSFKNRATEDIFNGKSTKTAIKLCPKNLWKIVFRKLDQLDSVLSHNEHVKKSKDGKVKSFSFKACKS